MNYYHCPFLYDPMCRTESSQTPTADPYSYPQNLPGALNLIRNAVNGEKEDELFYNYLLSVAPNQEAKNIITGIRDDERKHNQMFRKIYRELTGKILPPPQNVEFNKPKSYCDGVRTAMLGELAAVQRYRRILFGMQRRTHINMVTEIITDELRHATLYNYLYHTGKC